MKKNVGRTERIIRAVIGIAIIVVGVYYQSWMGILGAIIMTPSLIAWDPVYTLLGISSIKNTAKMLNKKYGKTALITGGSSGIGKALALQLAKAGITPILVARNQNKLDNTAKEIKEKYNTETKTYSVDLSNEQATSSFIKEINATEIGLFIHCAGLGEEGNYIDTSLEKELQVLGLNVTSSFLLTRHFAEKMTQQKRGGILLVSSMVGLMPSPYFTNYSASKAYIHNLGLSLYAELKDLNIDVSVLYPGLTETPMSADVNIDWSKMPMSTMQPLEVAKISLKNLGNKVVIIPGFTNQIMVAMSKRVFSNKLFSLLIKFFTKRAMS